MDAGYTFWSGRQTVERRDAGVALAICDDMVGRLHYPSEEDNNSRLMALHLTLLGAKFATVVTAYAPAITNLNELKHRLYEGLRTLLATVPRAYKLIGLGYFSVPSRQTTLPRRECWVATELPDSTTTASTSY
ncbi:hypothetical protein SprV_0100306700 [Sparganum proliferum]